jgi:hypothetical protein
LTSTDPVTYDLALWPAESRDALRWLLEDAGIDARWAASSFAIPAARRGDVDALVAYVNGTAAGRTAPDAVHAPAGAPGVALYQATQTVAAPGWYADPMREALWRWWDGQRWTGYVGPQLPARDRGWFPPANDREQTAKGGGLAIAGFFGGQALSLGVVGLAIALGASSRSAETLLVGELALWSGLFGACRLAVRRYGSGSLRDLGLVRPKRGDLGIGALAALVARVATLIIAVILVLVFSFDDLARDFWTWRANEMPVSSDDIPRLERPVGWVPDWSPALVESYRKQVGEFDRRWQAIDTSKWPVSRQVDYRLIGSAVARAKWELEISRGWRRNWSARGRQRPATGSIRCIASSPRRGWNRKRAQKSKPSTRLYGATRFTDRCRRSRAASAACWIFWRWIIAAGWR